MGRVSKAKWSLLGFMAALLLIAIGVMFLPPLTEGIEWMAKRTADEDRELEIGEQPVEMEVVGVKAGLEGLGFAVVLKEKEGERHFSIWVGLAEALSIDQAIRKEIPRRPLTHDLLRSAIEALDGELSFIIITELLEDIFYARVAVKTQSGRQIELDSRPSDAIALALRFEAPIYVEEWVLEKAGSLQQQEKAEPPAGVSEVLLGGTYEAE